MRERELSRKQAANEVTKVFEKAAQRLEGVDMSLSTMESLLDKQKTGRNGSGNPQAVHGTYLDKEDPSCPFGLCGGSRGIKIGDKVSTQCPCVRPERLREYINKKPQPLD